LELHDRIKYLRTKKFEMTQTEFGNALGVKRDVINNIENNRLKRPENQEPIYRLICEKFNVRENWLRNGEGGIFNPLEEEEEVATYVSELLEDKDNPLYQLIVDIMVTYSQLSPQSQEALRDFSAKLRENIVKKKES